MKQKLLDNLLTTASVCIVLFLSVVYLPTYLHIENEPHLDEDFALDANNQQTYLHYKRGLFRITPLHHPKSFEPLIFYKLQKDYT